MVQQASPSLHAILCRNTPGLNQAQQNICIEVPTSMPILRRAEKIVGAECAWQFRKNKWNCTGVDSTIFRQPHLPGEHHLCVWAVPNGLLQAWGYKASIKTSIMHSCEHWALCEHNQATIEHLQSHFTHIWTHWQKNGWASSGYPESRMLLKRVTVTVTVIY